MKEAMKFQSNAAIVELCFRKYKTSTLIYTSLFGLFIIFRVSYSFHTYHQTLFSIFFTILAIFIFSIVIYAAFRGAVLMNRSIRQIEISDAMVSFETFASTMFLGLVKRESMTVEIPRNLAELRVSEIKYGFDKQLTGDVYHLMYAGDKYLILN